VTNIRFTADEIREVLGEHSPHEWAPGELECSCSDQWVARECCYYCDAKLPKHKKDCGRPHPGAGTHYRQHVAWTEDHLIHQLWKAAGIDAKEGD